MSVAAGHVVVFGSINQDITLDIADFPAPGQTIMASGSRWAAGGKGANQAIAAALSGAPTRMLGAVGEDAGGRLALQALDQCGVGTKEVLQIPDVPTGTAYICVRDDGENTIVVDPGANHRLRAADVLPGPQPVPEWCLLSLEVSEDQAMAYAASCRDRGAQVVLNASPGLLGGLPEGLIDVLIVNEIEIEPLAGKKWRSAPNLGDALGVKAVLVTQGPDGVRVDAAGSPSRHVKAIPVPLKDSTGCGDAFAGVVTSHLAGGSDVVLAVEAAVVYAGCVAQHPGASSSYPQAFAEAARKLRHSEH